MYWSSFPSTQPPRRLGPYRVLDRLGEALGGVYCRGRDELNNCDVTLKIPLDSAKGRPTLMRGFQLEASALGVIRHPNVVTMLDFGLDDRESPCLVLERFSGWTLEQAMRQGAALRLDQKMGIVIQILAALGNAHSLGFVHRSMRPESILLQGDGLAKVMGIDLAPWAVDHREGMLRRAYYVSPEQVRGSTVDSRTDLFCVGCVLFEMLSGRPPFQSDELAPTLFSIVEEEPDYRSLPLGEEHDHLRRILGTALAKDPGDRYQTADRFAAELRLALKNQHTGNEGRKV